MAEVDTRNAEMGSPEWWLVRLYKKLNDREPGLHRLDRYYEGEQRLRFAMDRWRKAFQNQFRQFSENVCPLVVDSVEERLDVIGFRIGGDARGDDATEAWRMWQRSQMDAESQIGHAEALTLGMSYALVWNTDASADRAQITVESAHDTIVEHVPGSRWARAAALKVWHDDWTGLVMATVYLPDRLVKYQSTKKLDRIPTSRSWEQVRWELREMPNDEEPELPNRMGRVPVVPLYNRPRLKRLASSELHNVIPSQDAINKLTMDLLVASEFAAFAQRTITGVKPPTDPETGQPISDFWKQALESFLIVPDKEAKIGSIPATDLSNYIKAIEHEIQQVATRSQTPPHYFFLRGEFPSGESIVAAEAGLVAKARRRMVHWSDAWEEVVQLGSLIEGRTLELDAIDTLWRDPESRTEAQHVDAVGKKRQMLEVPLEQAWEDVGYTPTQIAEMLQQKAREAAAAPAPVAPPAAPAEAVGA